MRSQCSCNAKLTASDHVYREKLMLTNSRMSQVLVDQKDLEDLAGLEDLVVHGIPGGL